MQPTQGQGYWQPDDNGEQTPQANSTTPLNQSVGEAPSAFNGYELTEQQQTSMDSIDESQEIQWEASEYIHHEKSSSWFVKLTLVAIMLIVLAIVFRQWTFTAVIAVMSASLAVYAKRPPRTLRYHLSHQGVIIEDKFYPFQEFRAFGILQDGPLFMINLLPRKRFMPALSMYFEQQDGERIVDLLAAHLPHEQMKPDLLDTIVRKLRF
ncbi:hypothetical protein CYG49_03020 [Candidatus Saccharibacteria bacterium]|nr:MAG: hypothetical protein CYG49_03020 [Candidatus Saccharibacteria bacterium]